MRLPAGGSCFCTVRDAVVIASAQRAIGQPELGLMRLHKCARRARQPDNPPMKRTVERTASVAQFQSKKVHHTMMPTGKTMSPTERRRFQKLLALRSHRLASAT